MTLVAAAGFGEIEAQIPDWTPAFLMEYCQNTRSAYASDLKRFFAFCRALGEHPTMASRPSVSAFSRHEIEVGYQSTSTVSRRLSTLSSWFSYGVAEGYIDQNPVSLVRRPRVTGQSVPTGLDRCEIRSILDAAKADSVQSYALLLLLSQNGLRISEALGVNLDDFGSERGHVTLKIRRKGGKESTIPLNLTTADALSRLGSGVDRGPVFRNAQGERMTRQGAWRLVRKLAKQSLPSKAAEIHPHTFRHTFATQALDAGAPLHVVQDAMDHADPRTTQRYNRSRNNLDNHPTFLIEEA